MKKATNIVIAILDVFFMLGLLIKVLVGAGETSDYVGLCILTLLGASYMIPLFTRKNQNKSYI